MQHRFHLLAGLALGLLLAPHAGAQNGLKAFGPPNEFGYPTYYQDFQDLKLTHCVDQDDPLCGIPPEDHLVGPPVITDDPAEGNFFHESFYWSAFSAMTIPGRGDAELVLAVEGVFGNLDEAVIDGDQTVFARLRIRLRGDGFEGGFYRIGTPYGTFVFDAPAVEPGRRIVNHTVDCLHVFLPNPPPTVICGAEPFGPGANFFTTPLGILDDGSSAPQYAPIGPNFLVWDPTVPPLAPAGYVGDPAIFHPVIGAEAPNQNAFRVQFSRQSNFSNIVFDQSTNLFSILGKIDTSDPCDGLPPMAEFSADPVSGQAPLPVSFTDASTCATGWQWNFGDGSSSTLQNPSHTYAIPGTYSVTLTASGPGGEDAITKTDLITVTAPPGNELVLAQPVPGNAGVPNTYVVTGCTPGRQVGVYAGLTPGLTSLNVQNCVGLPLGLARPFRLIGRANANAGGVASIVATPPASSAGRTFFFQAVEPFTCRLSALISDVQ
jgi:hypothetical protein